MFAILRDSARRSCSLIWKSAPATPETAATASQRRLILLQHDMVLINIWLANLAADSGYAFSTLYEYAKVLTYVLSWLAQEPVQIGTGKRVGDSLLTLGRLDMRALFAWLDIPARDGDARACLCNTGTLPIGYRIHALAPATRNLRLAALSSFFDWIITEYEPDDGPWTNPLERPEQPLTPWQIAQIPEGLLPHALIPVRRPSKLLRRRPSASVPHALSATELQQVLGAIPQISHGRNAANRNGALLRLLLWGMLREAEVVHLTWEHINDHVMTITGKGDKQRFVPIADTSTWAFVAAYTNELRLPLTQRYCGAVLRQLDHEDKPLTIHSIDHLLLSLKSYFRQQAQLTLHPKHRQSLEQLANKLHSHLFRATGATYFAAAGMDLVKLSFLLGHTSPDTTKRYYIAADQMQLPAEVTIICQRVLQSLHHAEAIPAIVHRDWYERCGIFHQEDEDDSSHLR